MAWIIEHCSNNHVRAERRRGRRERAGQQNVDHVVDVLPSYHLYTLPSYVEQETVPSTDYDEEPLELLEDTTVVDRTSTEPLTSMEELISMSEQQHQQQQHQQQQSDTVSSLQFCTISHSRLCAHMHWNAIKHDSYVAIATLKRHEKPEWAMDHPEIWLVGRATMHL